MRVARHAVRAPALADRHAVKPCSPRTFLACPDFQARSAEGTKRIFVHWTIIINHWRTTTMYSKIAIALISTALLMGSAFAQTTTSKSDTPAATSAAKDGWRGSKLSG